MISGPQYAEGEFYEPSDDELANMDYQYAIARFDGIPYEVDGLSEDLYNLKKMISFMGASIIQQEAEFIRIYEEEKGRDPQDFPGSELDNAWHLKSYRPFSYVAMFMLIQVLFESRLKQLHNLLFHYGKLPAQTKGNTVFDLLKEFRPINPDIDKFYLRVQVFNLIRNKIGHHGGYFIWKDDTIFRELKKFAAGRADIELTEVKPNDTTGGFTHQLEIKNSSLLIEYIQLVRDLFNVILRSEALR